VLLEHPAVAQAVTFALPHPVLGEDVGAAVVLREAPVPSEREIREFVARRLADHKVPRRVLFLEELPKGPTGKLQRIGLAERLGITAHDPAVAVETAYVAPQGPLEVLLAALWADVLGRERIGARHRFLDVGGDSMLGTLLVSRVREALLVELPLLALFDEDSHVAGIAERMRGLASMPEELERHAALLLLLWQLSGDEVEAMLHEREVQRERNDSGSGGLPGSGSAQFRPVVPAE
jgi:oxalate---CoA ligase